MWIRALAFSLFLLPSPRDLDVGVPPGSPLSFVRIPVESPRAERKAVSTGPRRGPGQTVTTALDRVPRKPVPLSRPLTLDFGGHLRWKPKDPRGTAGTPTGGGRLPGYPPLYPQSLYVHCASFFLMVMLHEDEVSPREIMCYLVELGEPAAYAATAVVGEQSLKPMAEYVLQSAGGVPSWAPRIRSRLEIDKRIATELILAFPYEDRFGEEFLKLPGRVSVPSLVKVSAMRGHSFLTRNCVYALRLFDEEEVLPVLRKHLKSKDRVVRNRALAALIRWQDREIVKWLIDQLDSPDKPFRSYALFALGRIGDRRGVSAIARMTRRYAGDWEFLWGALAALARLRDSGKEVTTLLEKIPGLLGRMPLPDKRRKILSERVRIVRAYGGNPGEQAWMRTARVEEANRKLVEEWLEIERNRAELARRAALPPSPPSRPSPPAPPPKPAKPVPVPAPAPSPAQKVLAESRDSLLEYTGVRSVRAAGRVIHVKVETEADAMDLRILLGREFRGILLYVSAAP